jgi:hypothetical protein
VGYDIDDEQFGFKNESNSDINIGIVWCTEEASMADENEDGLIGGKFGKCTANNSDKVGMSGWVGSIELKDFRIVIDSGKFGDDDETHKFLTAGERHLYEDNPYVMGAVKKTREQAFLRSGLYVAAPTIVAELKNGPLFLRIFGKPDSQADLIPHIEEDKPTLLKPLGDVDAESQDKDQDVGLRYKNHHGIKVGYTTADLTVALAISSEYAYDADVAKDDPETKIKNETTGTDKNDHGSIAIGADLKVNVGPATLDLSFVQGLENANEPIEDSDPDDDTGIGVKLTTDFGDVSLSAGADVLMTGENDIEGTDKNEAMEWEAGGNATVTLTENTSLKSGFIHSIKPSVATDVKVVLSDKSGLVEDLSLDLTWGMFDIVGGEATDAKGMPKALDENDQADLLLEADLSYAIPVGGTDDMGDDEMMTKGPTLTPGTKVTVNQLDGGDATVGLEVRAILTDAVPATTFGLKWATKRLFDAADMDAEQGTVTLWTKIVY